MTRAFARPALQALAAAGTLLVFTWPFLVFDRPIQVVVSFFVSWLLVIGLLFAFSRARDDGATEGPDALTDESENA